MHNASEKKVRLPRKNIQLQLNCEKQSVLSEHRRLLLSL